MKELIITADVPVSAQEYHEAFLVSAEWQTAFHAACNDSDVTVGQWAAAPEGCQQRVVTFTAPVRPPPIIQSLLPIEVVAVREVQLLRAETTGYTLSSTLFFSGPRLVEQIDCRTSCLVTPLSASSCRIVFSARYNCRGSLFPNHIEDYIVEQARAQLERWNELCRVRAEQIALERERQLRTTAARARLLAGSPGSGSSSVSSLSLSPSRGASPSASSDSLPSAAASASSAALRADPMDDNDRRLLAEEKQRAEDARKHAIAEEENFQRRQLERQQVEAARTQPETPLQPSAALPARARSPSLAHSDDGAQLLALALVADVRDPSASPSSSGSRRRRHQRPRGQRTSSSAAAAAAAPTAAPSRSPSASLRTASGSSLSSLSSSSSVASSVVSSSSSDNSDGDNAPVQREFTDAVQVLPASDSDRRSGLAFYVQSVLGNYQSELSQLRSYANALNGRIRRTEELQQQAQAQAQQGLVPRSLPPALAVPLPASQEQLEAALARVAALEARVAKLTQALAPDQRRVAGGAVSRTSWWLSGSMLLFLFVLAAPRSWGLRRWISAATSWWTGKR